MIFTMVIKIGVLLIHVLMGKCYCYLKVMCVPEKGRAIANRVAAEVNAMLSTAWLMLGAMMYSLQLNTGSFPRPLSEKEEQHYISMAKEGDLEARNILIERNLRLVAHIMKND